jgi:hypothetical protein
MSVPDSAVGDQTEARSLAKVQFGGAVPLCDDFGMAMVPGGLIQRKSNLK